MILSFSYFCKSIAESEGAIRMVDNEQFDVVELDQGDGWTKVRRANLEEGFVPTTYLEIHLND